MPTFLVFKNGREVSRVRGADPTKLSEVVKKLAAEADSIGTPSGGFGESSSSASSTSWRGAELPRGYSDVTDQVEGKGLDLLNADNELGGVRTLFDGGKPSAIGSAKGVAKKGDKADWVESDTDEQLILYIPFQATLKIHTLHITSLPPSPGENGEDDIPMRPKTIKLYTNQAHNLGFEEAEDIAAVQEIVMNATDWDAKTGTAKVELRFVKFQKVTSLVVFVVDGEGSGERVRIDRLRIIGDTGEKRAMGKLEKIGDESGE